MGSIPTCPCGSHDEVQLPHEVGKFLSSIKGRNKIKKQQKAALEYLQHKVVRKTYHWMGKWFDKKSHRRLNVKK